MCLIITQPAGHTLARAHMRDIIARNADGFGIMRAHGGRLHVWRMVGTASEMLSLYDRHAAGRACVLHWRQATHGDINTDNAHPFMLTPDIAVVHNGMLEIGTPTRGMSDTWHLCTHVLAPMARDNARALFTPEMAEILGGMIGSGNKLVLLHADGRQLIVNESRGVEHAGRWYSNTYAWSAPAHLRPAPHYSRGMYSGAYGALFDDRESDTYASDTYASDTCASDTCASDTHTSDAPDWMDWTPTALDLEDQLVAAVEEDGEAGARVFVDTHPLAAAAMLADWYEIEPDEAAEAVRAHPHEVARWLADCAGVNG